MISPPKLYNELAAWWPLLSAPADYAEEAAFFRQILHRARNTAATTTARAAGVISNGEGCL